MASGFTTKLNRNFKASDLGQSFGAGGYGVGDGLTLSAGAGLSCDVAAGHGVLDGVIELAATSIVVSASTTNWIWLKQDGTLVNQAGTTAKPSGNCVLLGAAVTSGSAVTSIETSGVVYFKGGQLWRQTADTHEPTDSPSSSLRLFTTTSGGEFYWNGSEWLVLGTARSPILKEVTLGYASLSTAATTNTINGILLPAKACVHSVKIRVATAFAGTGISALTLDAGISGTANKYVSALDGTATGSDSDFTGYAESDSSTVQSVVKATATGANLDQLSAGSVILSIVYSVSA